MSELAPTQLVDLHQRVPALRQYLQTMLTELLGEHQLEFDFYREWNGGWRVRVLLQGRLNGELDCALLQTADGALLALPLPLPERWRRHTGLADSSGKRWTLDSDDQLIPF